jgi:hypothetical protein
LSNTPGLRVRVSGVLEVPLLRAAVSTFEKDKSQTWQALLPPGAKADCTVL